MLMIFACPKCQTTYNTPASAIGDGKQVRCSNCGHTWHQVPVAEVPLVPAAAIPTQMPQNFAYPNYPQPMYPPPGVHPGSLPPLPQGYPPAYPPAYPASPDPATPSPENMSKSINADTPSGKDLNNAKNMGSPAGNETLPSQEELDSMFGTAEELGTMTTLPGAQKSEASIRNSANLNDEVNPENIPGDMDPIPEVFTSGSQGTPSEDKPKKSRKGLIISMIALIIIGSIAGGIIFAKNLIISAMPEAQGIYDLIGLGPPAPGEGLVITNEKARRQTKGEGADAVETLIVTGLITNITHKEDKRAGGKVVEGSGHVVQVPKIRVILKDKAEKELQSSEVTPDKSELKPGEKMRFKIEIKNPSSLARKIEASFVSQVEEK